MKSSGSVRAKFEENETWAAFAAKSCEGIYDCQGCSEEEILDLFKQRNAQDPVYGWLTVPYLRQAIFCLIVYLRTVKEEFRNKSPLIAFPGP